MSIETVRDWVLIFAGILWGLVTLVVFVILTALWWYTRKGMRAGHELLGTKARAFLDRLHGQLAAVRDRTSRLPGNVPLPESEARPARGGGLSLPWRKKKRRFPLLGR